MHTYRIILDLGVCRIYNYPDEDNRPGDDSGPMSITLELKAACAEHAVELVQSAFQKLIDDNR